MNSRTMNIAFDNARWEAEQAAKDSEYAKFEDMIERAKKHFHERTKLRIYKRDYAVNDADGNTELFLSALELSPLTIIGAFRTVLDMMEEDRADERSKRAKHRIRNMDFY